MSPSFRPSLLALLVGPGAYFWTRRYGRAAIASVALAAAVLWFAYFPYLQVFTQLNTGGDSAGEISNTAVAATKSWLGLGAYWAPALAGTVLAINLICAIDLALIARRARGAAGGTQP